MSGFSPFLANVMWGTSRVLLVRLNVRSVTPARVKIIQQGPSPHPHVRSMNMPAGRSSHRFQEQVLEDRYARPSS